MPCATVCVQKSRLRRTRLELAHTRQQERLLEEFERRYVSRGRGEWVS